MKIIRNPYRVVHSVRCYAHSIPGMSVEQWYRFADEQSALAYAAALVLANEELDATANQEHQPSLAAASAITVVAL